jgi:hypothetical protein
VFVGNQYFFYFSEGFERKECGKTFFLHDLCKTCVVYDMNPIRILNAKSMGVISAPA